MANADSAFGFRPVRHLDGSPYNGQTEKFFLPATDSTAMYVGMPVKLVAEQEADGTPHVIIAGVTDSVLGIIVSFDPDESDLSLQYRPADTARYVNVAIAKDIVYEAQEDSDGGALATTDVGKVIRFAGTGGSTTSGLSTAELDSDTATATGEPFRLLRLVNRVDNAQGANAKWEVIINEHELNAV